MACRWVSDVCSHERGEDVGVVALVELVHHRGEHVATALSICSAAGWRAALACQNCSTNTGACRPSLVRAGRAMIEPTTPSLTISASSPSTCTRRVTARRGSGESGTQKRAVMMKTLPLSKTVTLVHESSFWKGTATMKSLRSPSTTTQVLEVVTW